jgi:putative methyltransferase (TIGR04325 family)
MSFAWVLALTARNRNRISMLDWGGGIGHYYVYAKALFADLAVDYHCRDVSLLAEFGARLHPSLHFSSDDECLLQSYDLTMASASLHYTKDWSALVKQLADSAKRCFYLAQVPCVEEGDSFVFVQRPYSYGYDTEYLSWCINRHELLKVVAQTGLRLRREFIYGHAPLIWGAPEQNVYRGFLFVREDS